jgi:hypothetical protein
MIEVQMMTSGPLEEYGEVVESTFEIKWKAVD